jgi:tetratricopeptide (TPR) repeat protein
LISKSYDETINACEHALQLDLHFAPAWKLLAKTYNVAGEAADAVNILRKATKVIPGDAELWNNLGVVLHDLGELAEVMDAYIHDTCRYLILVVPVILKQTARTFPFEQTTRRLGEFFKQGKEANVHGLVIIGY